MNSLKEREFFLSCFEIKFLFGTYKGFLCGILVKDKSLASDFPIIRSQLHFTSCVPLEKLYHLHLSFHYLQNSDNNRT